MTTTPAPRIKITYATLRNDNEELHALYEAGLEKAKGRLGQVHRNVVDGAERDGDGTFEVRSPIDTPSGPKGMPLVVEFTLAGQKYIGLNGGPNFPFTEAVSFQIMCDDQAEVDRLWTALTSNGGQESNYSWLKDRWGLSWQIVPKRLMEMLKDPDPGRSQRAMGAMMKMKKIVIADLEKAANGA